ncbi:MAG: molybdopterin cofactor-binding domain-containing protein [Syntrophobacteraceae bacterium]|jgi:4-hydroxybenzoyl-CoA reductase subunit alpha
MKEEFSNIGKGIPKVDSVLKATGKAAFGADSFLPGMLHGKVLRSTVPHAKIVNIDASAALKLPGVKAVTTGKDFLWGLKFGFSSQYRDQAPLAQDKVRYIGDEVAAVAAIDEDIAEEALDLIKVDYDILPAVFDPFEAMKEGAPLIHEDKPNNICAESHIGFGDVEKGFQESDHVREDEFWTQAVKHGFIEPHAALGLWDSSGKATIWANKQSPYVASRKMAMALGLKPSQLRLVQTFVGGGFGSARSDPHALDFCALLLSRKTGRPVKIVYTMEDVLLMGEMRHPFYLKVKTGMKKDGTLKAMQTYVVADGGAFTSIGPITINLAALSTDLPFYIPNVKYDAVRVFTNKGHCGSLRGHGVPQVRWALGQQLDMMCNDLGLDITEVSIKNAVHTGDVTPRGLKIQSCGLTECIEKAVEASGWKEKKGKLPPYRGIGMSAGSYYTGVKISGHNSASCIIRMNEDGTASVQTGATDIGQGSCTVISQIVAEVLGLRMQDITINCGVDTDFTPLDPGTYGSRVTFFSGNAAKLAAEDARRQLAEQAGKMLEVKPEELIFKDRKVYPAANPEKALKIDALIRHLGQKMASKNKTVWGRANYDFDLPYLDFKSGRGNVSPAYAFGVDVVEVEVDPETGKITIVNMVGAHDVGRVLNLTNCVGQVNGSWIMCQGQAMFEDLKRDPADGHVLNPNFMEYKLPTSMDIPRKVEHILVESIDPNGPFGAKEAGEGASVGWLHAFGNAVADAIGERFYDLPITPEKVLRAIRKKQSETSARSN